MSIRRVFILAFLFALVAGITLAGYPATGTQAAFESQAGGSIPIPASQVNPDRVVKPVEPADPDHITHPCGGIFPEPPFSGVSPLSITHVAGYCGSDVYSDPYGDIGVWQANGHNYVVLGGFALRMFYLFNVDDPYNPVLLRTQPFPSGGSASTSVFAFKQGSNNYVSATMRGSGGACGYWVYNVNDPANPQFVARKTGSDWCSVHEHFVSTDTNGNADYAWMAMGGESGYKAVALDIRNLPTITEGGRYQRPDADWDTYIHDLNVVGNRVYLAHWGGGVIIHDKATLATTTNPTPLNPINSIRPSNYWVHHVVPTTDGNHVFTEDEFINTPGEEKLKLYNISNIASPFYETGIPGTGTAAVNRAHNMIIKPISPGHDLLLVGWYMAGMRGYEVDTTVTPPNITEVFSHQLRQVTNGDFGNFWGVDYLPCTVRGQERTCIYGVDMKYGLVVDVLGYDPSLDPYKPETAITSPSNGQTLTTCNVTIQGTGHDYYAGLSQVEVSTDNGNTWHAAQGTANWTYGWFVPADGQYTLKVRGTDAAGNVEVPTTSVMVTVSGGCPSGETPTPSSTATRTNTPIPPTATFTHTPVPPTDTPTSEPTDTPEPPATSTDTPVPPSNTPTRTATPCSEPFTDVNPDDYFYEAVTYLYCHIWSGGIGIIVGYGDNTFRPYNYTTRSQLVKIVVLGFEIPWSTNMDPLFADVPTTNPFFVYVQTAAEWGIITGYECGSPGEPCDAENHPYFRPFNIVTRGQLTKITVEASGWAIDTSGGPHFSDVPPTDPFYEYVETAYNRGIISGYADNTFHPGSPSTRGQIAKIVYLAITSPTR